LFVDSLTADNVLYREETFVSIALNVYQSRNSEFEALTLVGRILTSAEYEQTIYDNQQDTNETNSEFPARDQRLAVA
jgi:hypothetical protein